VRICEVCGARYKGTPSQCPLDGGRLRELPDALLGQTIAGRYLVVEKIGGGGMGTVYRARDVNGSGDDVAIKFLLPDLAMDATNRERFLREAKAANRIDHENIIDVADFGETREGHTYLVMEFLEGIALAEEISQKGSLGVVRSVDIAMQCASALARAHELDVVHRDIKPENIYLVIHPTRRDFVKILDFGLAHMKGELRLTASGAVFGTPEYMAPEQARGAPLTGLADLYALGCVIFEMLAGTPPFSGTTPDLILKHMREPPPLASSRNPHVPPPLDAVVKKLLEKDPKKRHRDAHHLLEDLRRIADTLPMGRPSTPPVSADTLVHKPSAGRERAISIPADSTGPILPEAWEQRITLFRQLVPRAYPGQPPPAWLLPAIDELAARIAHVRRIEAELATVTEHSSASETNLRNVRLRLGRAIDELGRDESRAVRRLEELAAEIGDARRKLVETEAPLARALSQLKALPEGVSWEAAKKLRDSGMVAGAWLDLDAKIKAMMRETQERERERDDLRFQISQLKGRMGTMGAEQDLDRGGNRERAAMLGREHEDAVEDLQSRLMALLRHFGEFPALEDAVRSATLPPSRRAAAR
jgi:serine/threonine-protein kinase